MSMKEVNLLIWMTQLGLSVALPLIGFAFLGVWLNQSCGFGSWTVWTGLILGILSGVPVLAFGIPAVLSCYFDLFSGFVQALVFSLLSMVYIAGSCPPPEEQTA